MNRDDYLIVLKEHYIEEIDEALIESRKNQGEMIDYGLLNQLVLRSWNSAKIEGVPLELFINWVSDTIPEVVTYIELVNLRKSA